MRKLNVLPCLDSEVMAASRRRELNMPANLASSLGRSAVEAARQGSGGSSRPCGERPRLLPASR
jgi:hypothetical protein